jgi:hypothetical protein
LNEDNQAKLQVGEYLFQQADLVFPRHRGPLSSGEFRDA